VLCLLFLRGPQTPGELRQRSDRLYSFDGLDAVESTLVRLSVTPSDEAAAAQDLRPLVVGLPRQAGSREARYAHLLGGPVDTTIRQVSSGTDVHFSRAEGSQATLAVRLGELEAEVTALRAAIARIEDRLA
jgi:uncharacterized protein